jgi:hypothetical protein
VISEAIIVTVTNKFPGCFAKNQNIFLKMFKQYLPGFFKGKDNSGIQIFKKSLPPAKGFTGGRYCSGKTHRIFVK